MSKKVVLLSMDSLENFVAYDNLLIEPLNKLGWNVEVISWRKEGVNWNDYNAVIVRSTWDYQQDHQKFVDVLEMINNSSAHLENDLVLMKWNMNKKYLFDLEQKGIRIVNTIWENDFDENKIDKYFDQFCSGGIIFKPNISANADNTFKYSPISVYQHLDELKRIFNKKEFMVQPFMQNIVEEGEYSLFYFNGEFSHAILKKPKEKDFRVQEEHGGIIKSTVPTEIQKQIAKNIIEKLFTVPLYARIDLVRTKDNDFALMELELIEPSLYFNMDEQSAWKFALAFDQRMKRN